jgi:predicted Fe-Mo cluster-binding NifX family protein
MKIAVPTDDGQTIAPHFGRAQSFIIFAVESGEIISREVIQSDTPHVGGEHAQHAGGWFMDALSGCEVVIVTGMGRRAIANFQEAGIKPVFTEVADAEEAVKAYAQGNLETCDQPDCGRH